MPQILNRLEEKNVEILVENRVKKMGRGRLGYDYDSCMQDLKVEKATWLSDDRYDRWI